jgi:hypothetical protein
MRNKDMWLALGMVMVEEDRGYLDGYEQQHTQRVREAQKTQDRYTQTTYWTTRSTAPVIRARARAGTLWTVYEMERLHGRGVQ